MAVAVGVGVGVDVGVAVGVPMRLAVAVGVKVGVNVEAGWPSRSGSPSDLLLASASGCPGFRLLRGADTYMVLYN